MKIAISLDAYLILSAVMFLEWAVQGVWLPVLAPRLLGPLKMTGRQTGWIYATLPLAATIIPLIVGPITDQWIAPKWILIGGHLFGAVLLLLAAWQRTFWRLFAVMLCYSVCYAPTMSLVNTVLFAQTSDGPTQDWVFMWAPIGWALVGYFLTGWRWIFKTEREGTDCLYMAAVLSAIMGLCCCLLPAQELAGVDPSLAKATYWPILKAAAMFKDSVFLLFMLVSLAISGMMQFYFLSTGQFMQDIGISEKNISASMGFAQVVQTIATFLLLDLLIKEQGFKATLMAGAACWVLLYGVYILGKPRWLIWLCQGLHGLAFVFFMIAGQKYVDHVSPSAIASTMQSILFAVTTGLGPFICTYLAGAVMDINTVAGKFQWRKIWLVPTGITLAGILALTTFQNPPDGKVEAPDPPQ
jgi:MFS family permease